MRPIVLDCISVSLTGLPVLHTVGPRHITVVRAKNLTVPFRMHCKLKTSFTLLHKSNINH